LIMVAIQYEKNIMVPMRDGIHLATDVIRIDNGSPQPVLMARIPYDKNTWMNDNLFIFDAFRAAQAGYVVIVQDTRGRYGSEGEFTPMFQERTDGEDAIAWAAAQPWSNGKVGLFGTSYVGTTQWLAAMSQPENLHAIVPMVTYSDLYEGMMYHGGVQLLHGLEWCMSMAVEANRRRELEGGESISEINSVDPSSVQMQLPITNQPLLKELTPFALEWLDHSLPGEYWEAASPSSAYEQITVPALNIGGWYDVFLWGTLQNYMGMRQAGGSEAARCGQRLLIGPWSHSNYTGSFPELEFGRDAGVRSIDLTGIHLRWFDHWLKGIANEADNDSPVTIFVMGINQWRKESDWPLPDTIYRSFFLHSDGQANSLNGDGELSVIPQENEPCDTFTYNPLQPVPTVGGQVLLSGGNASGPRDQRSVEERDDVLIYSSAILEQAVEVTGPVMLELFVASSAKDTDFTGKLVDVFPDGRAIILTEGIIRARYHRSLNEPELLNPETIVCLRINLWATSNVFLPGHRIRLEVSSSNFPRYARNTNTGGDIVNEGSEHCIPAVNRVFHDADHPSHLLLPIIER
jgi:uncharacterized protein